MDLADFAQAAVADQFAGDAIEGHRALLRADLKDAIVPANRVDQHAALADVEGQRFFRVDVFAGLAGVDAGEHPLKLARADDDRIDVLAFQNLLVVLHDWPCALMVGLELLGPRQIAVAERNDLAHPGSCSSKSVARPPTPIAPTVIRSFAPGLPSAARTPAGIK